MPMEAMNAMTILRRGSKGGEVRLLQQAFNIVIPGAAPLALDGDFGSRTEARTKEYQARCGRGLVADGVVGPRTLGRLLQRERLTAQATLLRMPEPAAGSRPGFSQAPVGVSQPWRPPPRGPAFTSFRYDPQDALWTQQMRDWLMWLSLSPGPGTRPPPMPPLLPPSGNLLLRAELLREFPWLGSSRPATLILPGLMPIMPSVLPVMQDRIYLGAPARRYVVPPTGWTTELQLEGSASFNPLKPSKPIKTELEFTADLYRLSFLGKAGEFNAGAKVTPFDWQWIKGHASIDLKPLKWEHDVTGLSLALALGASLTLPPVEMESKLGLKAEWEWTKPLGASRWVEGKLGLWAGSKLTFRQDEGGGLSAQFHPLMLGGVISFSIAEPRQ